MNPYASIVRPTAECRQTDASLEGSRKMSLMVSSSSTSRGRCRRHGYKCSLINLGDPMFSSRNLETSSEAIVHGKSDILIVPVKRVMTVEGSGVQKEADVLLVTDTTHRGDKGDKTQRLSRN